MAEKTRDVSAGTESVSGKHDAHRPIPEGLSRRIDGLCASLENSRAKQ